MRIPVFLVLLSAFLGGSQALQVKTDPAEEVVVVEGQKNVNLLCLIDEPMDFCMYVLGTGGMFESNSLTAICIFQCETSGSSSTVCSE